MSEKTTLHEPPRFDIPVPVKGMLSILFLCITNLVEKRLCFDALATQCHNWHGRNVAKRHRETQHIVVTNKAISGYCDTNFFSRNERVQLIAFVPSSLPSGLDQVVRLLNEGQIE